MLRDDQEQRLSVVKVVRPSPFSLFSALWPTRVVVIFKRKLVYQLLFAGFRIESRLNGHAGKYNLEVNRALGKVTVLVRGVVRDFSQVHRSNSTLTLLLNGILARITVDADAVVQLCFDYLLILPTVFSLVRYTRRTGLKVATPLLVKIQKNKTTTSLFSITILYRCYRLK